jgi:hypothetical protein
MEKKHTKTKVFIFAIFMIIAITLIFDLLKFTDTSIGAIKRGNENLRCFDTRYEVQNVRYSNNNLMFELYSSSYNLKLNNIEVITDMGNIRYRELTNPLSGGDLLRLSFENVSINSRFSVSINGCEARNETV